jgi:hypothetical protein
MVDVLAKPFMRGGMHKMLRRHLPHLLAESLPSQPSARGQGGAAGLGAGDMGASDPSSLTNGHMSIKYENTSMQSSPVGQVGAWDSPGPITTHPGAMASHSAAESPMIMAGPGPYDAASQMVVPGGQPGGYHGYLGPGMGEERVEKRRRLTGPGMMER